MQLRPSKLRSRNNHFTQLLDATQPPDGSADGITDGNLDVLPPHLDQPLEVQPFGPPVALPPPRDHTQLQSFVASSAASHPMQISCLAVGGNSTWLGGRVGMDTVLVQMRSDGPLQLLGQERQILVPTSHFLSATSSIRTAALEWTATVAIPIPPTATAATATAAQYSATTTIIAATTSKPAIGLKLWCHCCSSLFHLRFAGHPMCGANPGDPELSTVYRAGSPC